jgi:hypothetical protein
MTMARKSKKNVGKPGQRSITQVEFKLIGPGTRPAPSVGELPADSGVLHSGGIKSWFATKNIKRTVQEIEADLAGVADTISVVAANLVRKVAGEFEMEEIEVALAVSAEGSIGVATAGAEATFTLKFARRK